MVMNLYHKRNERRISCWYPTGGTSNVLRRVEGVKLASFTGPGGRGITVRENDGKIRSLSMNKVVVR